MLTNFNRLSEIPPSTPQNEGRFPAFGTAAPSSQYLSVVSCQNEEIPAPPSSILHDAQTRTEISASFQETSYSLAAHPASFSAAAEPSLFVPVLCVGWVNLVCCTSIVLHTNFHSSHLANLDSSRSCGPRRLPFLAGVTRALVYVLCNGWAMIAHPHDDGGLGRTCPPSEVYRGIYVPLLCSLNWVTWRCCVAGGYRFSNCEITWVCCVAGALALCQFARLASRPLTFIIDATSLPRSIYNVRHHENILLRVFIVACLSLAPLAEFRVCSRFPTRLLRAVV